MSNEKSKFETKNQPSFNKEFSSFCEEKRSLKVYQCPQCVQITWNYEIREIGFTFTKHELKVQIASSRRLQFFPVNDFLHQEKSRSMSKKAFEKIN